MSYAIIGFGAIGQALARAFARKDIKVSVAARRPPEVIAPLATAIGPTVSAISLQDALKAQIVILAIPFSEIAGVASLTSWSGRTVVDATNAINFPDFTWSRPSTQYPLQFLHRAPKKMAGAVSCSCLEMTLTPARTSPP
jgi:predicted dinucleotide-binding enzyme